VSFTAVNPPVPPVLSTINWTNQTCSVTLQSNSGSSYTLEYRDSLSLTTWLALPAVSGNGAVLTLTDPAATNRQRFYRVRMQ
jgi:hypothetical protein